MGSSLSNSVSEGETLESRTSPGQTIAAILTGSWRASPPKLEVSGSDLEPVIPLLVHSGAGGLVWWRILHSPNRLLPETKQALRDIYLRYSMYAGLRENELAEVFTLLRAEGVEPILCKGWSTARCYADDALRPQGDIDLCVSPDAREAALEALRRPENQHYDVDLDHRELTTIDDRSFEELYRGSIVLAVCGVSIRTLGPEDHLRALCLHFLKHGGWRPLWLCDIAATLEARPATFDWGRCLGNDKRRAQWVLSALGLSDQLLGSYTQSTPAHGHAAKLPKWLSECVLSEWSHPHIALPSFAAQMGRSWREPRAMVKAIRDRWPNAIQATIDAKAGFGQGPRLPLQVLQGVKHFMNIATKWSVEG